MSPTTPTPDLATSAKRSWHHFLETYEPLRGELYRYCRHLTRSPWDAEDLVQDSLARAFVTLAQMTRAAAEPARLAVPHRLESVDRRDARPPRAAGRHARRRRRNRGARRARDPRGGGDAAGEAVAARARGGRAQGRVRLLAGGDRRGAGIDRRAASRRRCIAGAASWSRTPPPGSRPRRCPARSTRSSPRSTRATWIA